MTTFMDVMALAKRTLNRGEPELAGQMSVLALEAIDDGGQMFDDGFDAQQQDADKDALNDQGLLEALEDGDMNMNDGDGNMGKVGEIPIAMVLELSAMAKEFRDGGFVKEAARLNEAIEALSAGYSPNLPAFDLLVAPKLDSVEAAFDSLRQLDLRGPLSRRWALLCAKLLSDGKTEIAADVVATFQLRRVALASEVKQFDTQNGDMPVLEELHEMLDELGYDSLMKMGEKRRKELENGKPGIWVPYQQGTM